MSFCAQFAPVNRIMPGHRTPKGGFIDMLSMYCQFQLIPFLSSYIFSRLIYILLKTFSSTHFRNRPWQVEPEPSSPGSIFHWHPVLRMHDAIHYFSKCYNWATNSIFTFFLWQNGKISHPIIHLESL